MISVPRSELQKFLTVARRACNVSRGGTGPPVLFRQKREDLKLSCVTPAGAVEFRIDEGGRAATFVLTFDVVKQCAGGSQQPVEFEVEEDRISAAWQENGSARTETFDSVSADSFPRLPKEFRGNADLLPALREAARTACQEAAHYSLQYIQMQGKLGRIVATDAHQLFIQDGFDFPWNDDLLLPASGAFQCKELNEQDTASIGRTTTHVFFTAGPWTLALPNQQGRFPDACSLIPSDKQVKSRLRITDADARFAIDQLPDLPCDDDLHETVTVDLNGRVLVRAAGGKKECPVELALSGSSCTGRKLKFGTDRRFLRRALQLGFREIGLTGPESPAVCRDGQRTYLWALLDDHVAVPSKNVQRISSSSSDDSPTTPKTRKIRSRMPRNTQSQNGSTSSENGGIDGLIEQAEVVKTSLRETLGQVNTFISDLKRHKKQAKLVRSTLMSLKQLQSLDA